MIRILSDKRIVKSAHNVLRVSSSSVTVEISEGQPLSTILFSWTEQVQY